MGDDDEVVGRSAWPAPHHDLRASSGAGFTHALLGWQRSFGLQGRILGYRRAAELLADAMLAQDGRRDLDTVVFPFANCWRHYLELHLKALLGDLQKLVGDEPRARGGHNLQQLWSELEALLTRAYGKPGDEDKQDLRQVRRLIGQLSQLDPNNEDFRYATRRKGGPSLPDVEWIDVREFHPALQGVANWLGAVDAQTDHHLDLKRDMEAEFRREEEAREEEFRREVVDVYPYSGEDY